MQVPAFSMNKNKKGVLIMSLKKFVLSFIGFYFLAIIVSSFILSYFELRGNSSIPYVIIIALLMMLLEKFSRKNQRYLNKVEFKKIFWSILGFLAFFSLLVSIPRAMIMLPKDWWFTTLAIVLPLDIMIDAFVIYFTLKFTKKMLIKRKVIEPDDV